MNLFYVVVIFVTALVSGGSVYIGYLLGRCV